MATEGIDHDLLHWHLWERRDRRGMVEFTQKELADDLHVDRSRISQVIAEMVEEGRLEAAKARGRYKVVDPSIPPDADEPDET